MAAAEFALHKLHMTLTILRKNKNTTTSNLLAPIDNLGLAQRSRQRKEPVRVECKQSCPTRPKPSYSRLGDRHLDEGGTRCRQQSFFLGRHLILRNQMASNALVKRLLWVYSLFMLYLVVASLLGVAGVVYLPLRMDLPPAYGHDVSLYLFLVLYWTVIVRRIGVRRRTKRAAPTKPW